MPAVWCDFCDNTDWKEEFVDMPPMYYIEVNGRCLFSQTGVHFPQGFCKDHIREAVFTNFDKLFPPFPKQHYTIPFQKFGDLAESITDYLEAIYKKDCIDKVMESIEE